MDNNSTMKDAWKMFDSLKYSKYTNQVEQYLQLIIARNVAKETILDIAPHKENFTDNVKQDLNVLFDNLVEVEADLHVFQLLQ